MGMNKQMNKQAKQTMKEWMTWHSYQVFNISDIKSIVQCCFGSFVGIPRLNQIYNNSHVNADNLGEKLFVP